MFTAGLLLSRRKRKGKILGISLAIILVITLLISSSTWAFVIFNVLGYVLFGIISLLIIIILLAFFAKFRYDIKVDKAGTDEPWKYAARASWYLGMVKATIESGKEPEIKLFGVKLNVGKDKEPEPDEPDETPEKPAPPPHDDESAKKFEKARATTATKRKRRETKVKAEKGKSIKALLDEIGKENLKAVFKLALGLLKDILLTLKPKHLRIRGKIGLEEPDQTGMAMAGASVIQAVGIDIYLQGDFEEKALELDITAHGNFRLWRFIRLGLKFWLQAEVQRIYKLYKNHTRGDDKNGDRI